MHSIIGFQKEGKFSLVTSAHTRGGTKFSKFFLYGDKIFLAKRGHGPMALPLKTPLHSILQCVYSLSLSLSLSLSICSYVYAFICSLVRSSVCPTSQPSATGPSVRSFVRPSFRKFHILCKNGNENLSTKFVHSEFVFLNDWKFTRIA